MVNILVFVCLDVTWKRCFRWTSNELNLDCFPNPNLKKNHGKRYCDVSTKKTWLNDSKPQVIVLRLLSILIRCEIRQAVKPPPRQYEQAFLSDVNRLSFRPRIISHYTFKLNSKFISLLQSPFIPVDLQGDKTGKN